VTAGMLVRAVRGGRGGVRWSQTCGGVIWAAEERPVVEDVTNQRREDSEREQ
jgi:hypothetical protein